jgi:hypothetical protein
VLLFCFVYICQRLHVNKGTTRTNYYEMDEDERASERARETELLENIERSDFVLCHFYGIFFNTKFIIINRSQPYEQCIQQIEGSNIHKGDSTTQKTKSPFHSRITRKHLLSVTHSMLSNTPSLLLQSYCNNHRPLTVLNNQKDEERQSSSYTTEEKPRIERSVGICF